MAEGITIEEVAQITDTEALWQLLKVAKKHNDRQLLRAVEQRMRELGDQSRFAHLSDTQLAAQIKGLAGNRAPTDVLAYSPADGQGLEGAADTAALNRQIRANQRVGIEATLGTLLDERRRRRNRSAGKSEREHAFRAEDV